MGCFNDDCISTDKFASDSMDDCAKTCMAVEECTHWTFGDEEGSTKCWIRNGDGGRETWAGFKAGSKFCAPPDAGSMGLNVQNDQVGNAACWVGDSRTSSAAPDTMALEAMPSAGMVHSRTRSAFSSRAMSCSLEE